MNVIDDSVISHRARGQIARRRGALNGVLLIALGAWGALIPFIGPYFHFAYTPDQSWHWTSARGWLEVLPGVVVVVGAWLVLTSARRSRGLFGSWLAAAGGAWLVVGGTLNPLLHIGSVGSPAGDSTALRVVESLAYFTGLGVVIVFLAATAAGRLSVRSLSDMHAAQRGLDHERDVEVEQQRERDDAVASEIKRRETADDAGPTPTADRRA